MFLQEKAGHFDTQISCAASWTALNNSNRLVVVIRSLAKGIIEFQQEIGCRYSKNNEPQSPFVYGHLDPLMFVEASGIEADLARLHRLTASNPLLFVKPVDEA
jgi:hypothetical protein